MATGTRRAVTDLPAGSVDQNDASPQPGASDHSISTRDERQCQPPWAAVPTRVSAGPVRRRADRVGQAAVTSPNSAKTRTPSVVRTADVEARQIARHNARNCRNRGCGIFLRQLHMPHRRHSRHERVPRVVAFAQPCGAHCRWRHIRTWRGRDRTTAERQHASASNHYCFTQCRFPFRSCLCIRTREREHTIA